MQITEVFEGHDKTVTRQSSSQRKCRLLSGKLHCLNFVRFPAETKPLAESASAAKRRRRPFRCRYLRSLIINFDIKSIQLWVVFCKSLFTYGDGVNDQILEVLTLENSTEPP